jgi:hypothetical protein
MEQILPGAAALQLMLQRGAPLRLRSRDVLLRLARDRGGHTEGRVGQMEMTPMIPKFTPPIWVAAEDGLWPSVVGAPAFMRGKERLSAL